MKLTFNRCVKLCYIISLTYNKCLSFKDEPFIFSLEKNETKQIILKQN